ncbi:uncharacterized protein H6S33_012735 [Morchella sextelata]|uniref:uncharacterized protein n=1 Tax=Morchella sextelata TaxID=1174677 RepID=UPI001D05A949|nr:uncharacterized protein H6S33_012735 [Morchella sextelata]KAH0609249.1 hypothetical protein H6S33_012735 [Morchella sextelata]
MPKRPRRIRRPAANSFQPLQTFLQILSLQCIYYVTSTATILFSALVAGVPFGLDLIFSAENLRGDTAIGWTLGILWVLSALVMVIAQTLIHARSKLVLDFSLTLHFLHLVVVALYDGALPASWFWWGVQVVSAMVMVVVGTWACTWRELRPIPFGGNGGAGRVGVGEGSAGGGADGGGEYEMVQMKEEEV